jgi:uncharacterized membrane protein YadS
VLLYAAINHLLPLTDVQYGVWAGLSMQAVPNALAAAFARSPAAGDVGTIVKMARVALLAPIALGLALWFRPRREAAWQHPSAATEFGDEELRLPSSLPTHEAGLKTRAPARAPGVPLYVILFVLAGALNSTGWLPGPLTDACAQASAWLMIVAMSALGLGVDFASLRQRAGPAFTMSAVLFLMVALSAFAWSAWVVAP